MPQSKREPVKLGHYPTAGRVPRMLRNFQFRPIASSFRSATACKQM
jgi:hypothetical protein